MTRKKKAAASPQQQAEQAERDKIAPSGVKPVEAPAKDAAGTQPDVVQSTVGDKARNRDEKALATVREVWAERNEAAYYRGRTNIDVTIQDASNEKKSVELSTSEGRLHIKGDASIDRDGLAVLVNFVNQATQAV